MDKDEDKQIVGWLDRQRREMQIETEIDREKRRAGKR